MSQTDITIDESATFDIVLRLDAPIQCQDPHALCRVQVTFTNENPDEIVVEPCGVVWDIGEWEEERTIRVTAVDDFVDDGERSMRLVSEPARSSAAYYSGVNPADIYIRTRPRPSATCSSTGDPHTWTFDGGRHDVYWCAPCVLVVSRLQTIHTRSAGTGTWYSTRQRSDPLRCR